MQLVILRWGKYLCSAISLRLLLFAKYPYCLFVVSSNLIMNLKLCVVYFRMMGTVWVWTSSNHSVFITVFLFTFHVDIFKISHMHIHAVLIHMYTYPYIIYRRVRKTADWNKVSVCCKVLLCTDNSLLLNELPSDQL